MEKLYVREVTSKYRKLQTKVNVMSDPSAVWQFLRRKIGNNCQEHFVVLGIDNKNTLIFYQPVSVGTVTESIAHPREVFHLAVRELCSGIIICHNHPSGNPAPSKQDIETTRRLIEAGKILGIPVVDHIIITPHTYYSLKENGYI